MVEQENSAINEITDEYDEDILFVEEEMEEDAQAYEDAEIVQDEEKLEDEIEAATDDEEKEDLEEDLEEEEVEKDDIDEEYEEVSRWGYFVMVSTVLIGSLMIWSYEFVYLNLSFLSLSTCPGGARS